MSTTTNYALTKPTVGADTDTWGNELNTDLDLVDAALTGVANSLINGLTLSTAGSSATFSVAAGNAGDSSGHLLTLGASISKTTSSWTVGNSNGALDTGAIANNTWYHVFIIQRTDTGVVDILISTSATSPTMPSSYTLKRRIGAMKTNGSGQWTKFTQLGDEFTWDTAVTNDINFNPTATLSAQTVNVPTGINVKARLRGWCQVGASEGTAFLVYSPLEAGVTSINVSNSYVTCLINAGTGSIGTTQGFAVDVITNTSAQVNVIAGGTVSGSTLIRAQAYGWVDPRGKF